MGVPLLICCTTALCYVAVNPGNPSLDPLNVMCRGETLVPRLGTGRGCYPPLQEGKEIGSFPPLPFIPFSEMKGGVSSSSFWHFVFVNELIN